MLLQKKRKQLENWQRNSACILNTSKDHSVTKLIALTNQYLIIALVWVYAIYKSLNFFEILGFWHYHLSETLGSKIIYWNRLALLKVI